MTNARDEMMRQVMIAQGKMLAATIKQETGVDLPEELKTDEGYIELYFLIRFTKFFWSESNEI